MSFCRACRAYIIGEDLVDIKKQLVAHFKDKHDRSPAPNPGDLLFPFNFEEDLVYPEKNSFQPFPFVTRTFFSSDYYIAVISQANFDSCKPFTQEGWRKSQQMLNLWLTPYISSSILQSEQDRTRKTKAANRKKQKIPSNLEVIN